MVESVRIRPAGSNIVAQRNKEDGWEGREGEERKLKKLKERRGIGKDRK